jgi:hypothetical protein
LAGGEIGGLLYADLVGACGVPHTPSDQVGSLGRGPLAQVRFFSFFLLLFLLFFSVINIFLFQNLTFFMKLFFKIFFKI